MLLSHNNLFQIVADGILEGALEENINAASIDVRLGNTILYEGTDPLPPVDLAKKQSIHWLEKTLADDECFELKPGAFVLGQTVEVFNLPDYIAGEFRLRSSMARNGLDQALAVWLDPGFKGSVLTIELRNNSQNQSVLLTPGMRVGQMIFYLCYPAPHSRSYSSIGRYNDSKTTTASRGHGDER